MRILLLPLCLTLWACAASDRAAPSASAGSPGLSLLYQAQTQLRDAVLQQQVPELWSEVEENARQARAAFEHAQAQGAPAATVEAGVITAEQLLAWHQLYLDSFDVNAMDTPAAFAAESLALRLDAVLTSLRGVEGRLSSTSLLLTDIEFQTGDAQAGGRVLTDAVRNWPDDDDVHELARAWRDALPDPAAMVTALDAAMADHPDDNGLLARCLHTRAYMNLSQAGTDYDNGLLVEAGTRYTASAEDFQRAYAAQITLTADEADVLAATAFAYAGWSQFHLAERAATDGEDEAAVLYLVAAEKAFGQALGRVGGHADGIQGLDYVGDFYVNPEHLNRMEQGRDYFCRVARRFNHADWWNNYAFFCRETGEYDESYRAYERCIALEPNNARWVNDTALIPVYHSAEMKSFDDSQFDRVEELLKRAWKLGKDVCDNPFVSDETYAQNFEAYGDAMLNLSRLYLMQGRVAEARQTLDELIDAAPRRIDARQLSRELETSEKM